MQGSDPDVWLIPSRERSRALPFAIGSILSIVVGGLIAAVSSPLGWAHGSWAAAYLVLVGGVAQVALIVGRLALVADRSEDRDTRLWPHFVLWNVATLLVIGGTLLDSFILVLLGSVGLLIVLALFWPPRAPSPPVRRTWGVLFRLFLVFLALSTIIGCVLTFR